MVTLSFIERVFFDSIFRIIVKLFYTDLTFGWFQI